MKRKDNNIKVVEKKEYITDEDLVGYNLILTDYTKFEKDMEPLANQITRHLKMNKVFNIELQKLYNAQNNNEVINDKTIIEMNEKMVREIYKTLSLNYVAYLTTMYFNGSETLIKWISETTYMPLLEYALQANEDNYRKYRDNISTETVKYNKNTVVKNDIED